MRTDSLASDDHARLDDCSDLGPEVFVRELTLTTLRSVVGHALSDLTLIAFLDFLLFDFLGGHIRAPIRWANKRNNSLSQMSAQIFQRFPCQFDRAVIKVICLQIVQSIWSLICCVFCGRNKPRERSERPPICSSISLQICEQIRLQKQKGPRRSGGQFAGELARRRARP